MPISTQAVLFEQEASSLQGQRRLLRACVKKSISLAAKLSENGSSIDELEYEIPAPRVRGEYLSLDRLAKRSNGIPFVSLFAGCGGMDLGFEAAGFKHRAAVEINPLFASTIKTNRPNWKVLAPPTHSGDVSRLYETASALQEIASLKTPFEGVFVGGPPCQPFSIAANQRFSKSGDDFKRTGFQHANGNLLFNYTDLIEMFLPKAFLIENVPGLIDVDSGEQIALAIKRLRHVGYFITEPLIINAADYAVPQNRFRMFLIGIRGGSQFVPPLKANTSAAVGPALRFSRNMMNHQPHEHKAESILRYMDLDLGERDQLGRVDRLDPRYPSKTIIAGGTKGGGRSHLHPYIPRTLTVRECARIQTFPDDYVFNGPIARQFTQVGNAVPPILAAQIANSLAKTF
jgi:DNA (cytosine-5)-methyltransferase 1